MASDEVSIRIRARGSRETSREISGVGKSLISVGRAGQIAGRGLTGATRAAGGFGRTITSWRTAFVVGGIGSIGVAATRMGLQFNASMEQNQLAFTNFLGSTQAAGRELRFLQQTAAKTPFELPQITQATRQLLAFGFPARQANSLLGTMGDAAAGAGLGADAIDQMVRAFGQIRGKGTLQAEELQQLGELGLVNRGKLAKNLGITTAQLADAGNQGISANRAISALQKTLDDTFGGQSAKQARTFNGQLSTLHDNINATLGTITKPAFTALERRVFPALTSSADRVNQIFGRHDIDLSQKLTLSKVALQHRLGPVLDDVGRIIGRMHLGDKLAHGFELAVPRIADAAGRAAPKVAGAFVRGFLNAGPYGKLFAVGLIAKKLGAFTLLGRLAAARFLTTFGPTVAAGETAAAGSGAAGAGASKFLPLAGRAVPPILAAVAGWEIGKHLKQGHLAAQAHQHGREKLRSQGKVEVSPGVFVDAKDAGWGRSRLRARGPRARGATINHTTIVKVRDREIGRATDRYHADERARNRSRNR